MSFLRTEPALAQGAATGDIPSTKPKFPVTRPEQLFLRSYGDSRGADHYSVLEAVSEASAQVRGANGEKSRDGEVEHIPVF